jgi:hypothetical protein
MTVRDLKKALESCEDSMDVFMAERKTDFAYGLVNSVTIRRINMSEEPDGESLAEINVIVLDEE